MYVFRYALSSCKNKAFQFSLAHKVEDQTEANGSVKMAQEANQTTGSEQYGPSQIKSKRRELDLTCKKNYWIETWIAKRT